MMINKNGTVNFKAAPYEFVKTLEKFPLGSYNAKYFCNGYPILAKYVPQSHYSVVKHTGQALDQLMATTGCYPCSKLTMYDYKNKIGFLAHVNNDNKLINSAENIKASLLKNGASIKNLILRHVGGVLTTPQNNVENVYELMHKLNIKQNQLLEEDVIGSCRSDGIILDLKDGQTYELNKPDRLFETFKSPYSFKKFKKYYAKYAKNIFPEHQFNIKEFIKLSKEAKAINEDVPLWLWGNDKYREL